MRKGSRKEPGKSTGEQSTSPCWLPGPTSSELAFFFLVHVAFCPVVTPLTPFSTYLSYQPITHQHLGPPRQSRRGEI